MFRIGSPKREDCRSDLLYTRKLHGQVDCIGKAGWPVQVVFGYLRVTQHQIYDSLKQHLIFRVGPKSQKLVHEMRMAQNRLGSTLVVFVVNVGS